LLDIARLAIGAAENPTGRLQTTCARRAQLRPHSMRRVQDARQKALPPSLISLALDKALGRSN
jgi:hypothetical protein